MRLVTIGRQPASEVGGQTRIRMAGLSATPTPSGSSRPRRAEQSSGFCRICHSPTPPSSPTHRCRPTGHSFPGSVATRYASLLLHLLSVAFPFSPLLQKKKKKKNIIQLIYDFNQGAKLSVSTFFFFSCGWAAQTMPCTEKQMRSWDNKESSYIYWFVSFYFIYLCFYSAVSRLTLMKILKYWIPASGPQISQIATFYWNTCFFVFLCVFFPASVYVKNEKCKNVGWLASAELLNRVSRSLAYSCIGWYIKFAGEEESTLRNYSWTSRLEPKSFSYVCKQ